ncbi:MAG TPA: DUF4040 domain-containing protein [Chromatiaceae bacterium]|nr:DUF4040 domain-containing protein [Chromatiaceae bacterium]
MSWVASIIVIVMLAAAVAVLLLKDFLSALAALAVVSLALSVLFVILRAPDVAMTEAAVGAGLGSLLFALAIRRMGLARGHKPEDRP